MELLLFGPLLCAGVYLLTSPSAVVPILNAMMKTAHEMDHGHGLFLRPIWELRAIPDSRALRIGFRTAGLLLIGFASAHLSGIV